MEDALADEMNMRKKIKQTNDDINQIRFRLHEAEEKLSKAQANSDANGRTAESLKLVYDNAKTEYEKANYTYTQSSSIISFLKFFISLIMRLHEATIIKQIMMKPKLHMILLYRNSAS